MLSISDYIMVTPFTIYICSICNDVYKFLVYMLLFHLFCLFVAIMIVSLCSLINDLFVYMYILCHIFLILYILSHDSSFLNFFLHFTITTSLFPDFIYVLSRLFRSLIMHILCVVIKKTEVTSRFDPRCARHYGFPVRTVARQFSVSIPP